MSFAATLAEVRAGSTSVDAFDGLARQALQYEEEEQALPLLKATASRLRSAALWQWTGLLQRAIDEHEDALASFEKAASLAPGDSRIAHGRARVALEAGLPAVELFERALRLAPADPDILLGLAAAQFAQGEGFQSQATLQRALDRNPLWLQGHVQLAQLRSMLGLKTKATQSVEQALQRHPTAGQLWTALFNIAIKASDFQTLAKAVAQARQAGAPDSLTLPFEFIAVAENGEAKKADALLARIGSEPGDPVAVWRVRHLLRAERAEQALAVVERGLQGPAAAIYWPYASIAWKLCDDPRWPWLEAGGRLVSAADLTRALPDTDSLAATLRQLHEGKGEYLDQSVRGGSQTDGPLFSRIEPSIRALRAAVVKAVERYVAALPDPDPKHPLLGRRRDRPIRFSGSWSVRLRDAGFHANHVHPQGWISSAFYVALPAGMKRDGRSGWLTLGSPPSELGLQLPASSEIEPSVGKLVLFPSWMWHGTIPFESGERMTVAFDVRPPN